MPYELFYGNPNNEAVSAGVFESSRSTAQFARDIERNKLFLEQRKIDLASAQLTLAKKSGQIQAEQVQKQFDQHATEWKAAQDQKKTLDVRQQKEAITAERNRLIDLGASGDPAPGLVSYKTLDGKTAWVKPSAVREIEKLKSETIIKDAPKAAEQLLKDRNQLSDWGASETPGPGLVEQRDSSGKPWYVKPSATRAVETATAEAKAKAEVKTPEPYTPAQKKLLAALDDEIQTTLKLQDNASRQTEKYQPQLTLAETELTARQAEKEGPRKAANVATAQAKVNSLRKQLLSADLPRAEATAGALAMIRDAAIRNPAVLNIINPADARTIDWAKLDPQSTRAFQWVLANPNDPRAAAALTKILTNGRK